MGLLVDSRLAEQTVFMRANAKRRIVFDETPWAEKVAQLGDAAKLSNYAYLGFVDQTGKGTLFDTAKTPVDISKEAFFTKALAGTPNFSPIMKDPVTGEDCIFVAAPALDNGVIKGVLFGKKSVSMLQDIIKDFSFGSTGYAYLLDSTGTVVAHPNTQMVTDKFNILDYANKNLDTLSDFRDTVENQVLKGQTGSTQYNFNGKAILCVYTPVIGSDWTLMVAIDHSEVNAPVNTLILSLVILMLLITVFVLVTTLVLGHSISAPILYLTQIVERFGSYDLSRLSAEESVKLQKLTLKKDEVGRIAASLVHLQENLSSLITHAKDISSQLAASSQELSAISEQSALTSDSIAQN
ncbi:MAG: cache domain-containing protein, partial [Plesiomonas sp.]